MAIEIFGAAPTYFVSQALNCWVSKYESYHSINDPRIICCRGVSASSVIVKLIRMRTALVHSRDWEELASLDPLWAILSDPAKRFGGWDLDEFFRSGAEDVSQLMEKAGQLGLPRARRRAVDFGCGVGRLTRALREHFSECHGVDISNSMVEAARRLTPACEFRQGADLGSFPADWADLIYSHLVLQHQPDRASVFRIISGMLRVLAPGGLLVFQIPVSMPWRNRLQLRRRAYRALHVLGFRHKFLYERLKLNPIRMIAVPRNDVEKIIRREGSTLLRVDQTGVPGKGYVSGFFYCSKN